MIKYYYRNVHEEQLTALDKFRTGSWIHVEAPNEAERTLLVEKFGLDEDLLQDALDPYEIPRSEAEGLAVYVYMRYAWRSGDQVHTTPVLLVVGPNFVATITSGTVPQFERLLKTEDMFTTQRAKMLLQLARHMISTYETNATHLTRQIQSVRSKLNVAAVNNRDFIRFVVIEDALNSFLAELVPTNLILSTLLAGRYKQLAFYEDDKDLIEDLVQITHQLIEIGRSGLHTIVNIREAYSNIMTNNLNRQIQLLTSLTVVLTLPTIVFSLYGMNVPLPGQHDPNGFTWIVGATTLVCAFILYLLYKKRWL